MQRELSAIYHELVRRHQDGEKQVRLSDESLAVLLAAAREKPPKPSAGKKAPEGRPPAPSTATPKISPGMEAPKTAVPQPKEVVLPDESKEERWSALRERVLQDPWCLSQVKPGKKVVFGTGAVDARIFFCGEAPGAEEEIKGEPFVGPAGQLLTRIIGAMGLTREEVYIGNIMNYRPPMPGPVGNRPPNADEMAYCLPFLVAQLDIVQPEVIVALGMTAIDGLLGPDSKRRMTRFRGNWQAFRGIPVMPTFHPSYLLRNQSLAARRQIWEDMLAVMDRIGMPVTEKQRGYFLK